MAKINLGMLNTKINGISINSSVKCNTGNYNNTAERDIKYLVAHYTGNKKDVAVNNAKYFTSPKRGASAHFFVDDSSIYQSVELRDVAWHCGTKGKYYHSKCRNSNSIGIEMCCTAGNYKISETTKINAAYLFAYLCNTLGIKATEVDTYVVRHYDVTHKSCPAQMVSNNGSEWADFKNMIKNILNTGTHVKKKVTSVKDINIPVRDWQKAAIADGYTQKKGYFKKYGADGSWGSECEEAAKKIVCKKLVVGYTNKNLTKIVQKAVGVNPDGKFGKGTRDAVIAYQNKNGLTDDGVVGYKTWKKILKK